MARVNMKGLQAEIAQKGYRAIKPQAAAKVKKIFNRAKQELISDFDSHSVTQEIEGGSSAGNISNTLGGYGNLFSFIGFDSGADPISPIRSLLARSIQIKSFRRKARVLGFKLRFTVPTLEDIKMVAPMPWSTDNWVEAVERGMMGLGQYFYRENKSFNVSRSGPAIQLDVELPSRGGNSSPTDYMTGILSRMLKDIERNLRRL
jgi:hypothetical protein